MSEAPRNPNNAGPSSGRPPRAPARFWAAMLPRPAEDDDHEQEPASRALVEATVREALDRRRETRGLAFELAPPIESYDYTWGVIVLGRHGGKLLPERYVDADTLSGLLDDARELAYLAARCPEPAPPECPVCAVFDSCSTCREDAQEPAKPAESAVPACAHQGRLRPHSSGDGSSVCVQCGAQVFGPHWKPREFQGQWIDIQPEPDIVQQTHKHTWLRDPSSMRITCGCGLRFDEELVRAGEVPPSIARSMLHQGITVGRPYGLADAMMRAHELAIDAYGDGIVQQAIEQQRAFDQRALASAQGQSVRGMGRQGIAATLRAARGSM